MSTVRLAFSPAPQYVRTARLVAVAVARRAGVADDQLEAVRLAIGETCGRAVARQRHHGVDALIQVEMSDDGPYTVRVVDSCGTSVTGEAGAEPPAVDGEEETGRMGETLLAAAVEDLTVHSDHEGTEVRMAWPVRRRSAGSR